MDEDKAAWSTLDGGTTSATPTKKPRQDRVAHRTLKKNLKESKTSEPKNKTAQQPKKKKRKKQLNRQKKPKKANTESSQPRKHSTQLEERNEKQNFPEQQ